LRNLPGSSYCSRPRRSRCKSSHASNSRADQCAFSGAFPGGAGNAANVHMFRAKAERLIVYHLTRRLAGSARHQTSRGAGNRTNGDACCNGRRRSR
jgi:hypothetical protein